MTGQMVTENGNDSAGSEGVWTMTDTELNEELRRAKEQAWEEGITRGRELAAWALGTQGPEHRPSADNPYRSEQ